MAEDKQFTAADLQAIIASTVQAVVTEMRKPTPEEEAKRAEEQRKLEEMTKRRIANAQAEESAKKNLRANCPHGTTHPGTGAFKHTWRGQTDPYGYFHPMCQQCQTVLPKVKSTQEMMTGGVNLNQYTNMNVEILEKWHKATVPDCSDPDCYLHAKVAVGA